MTEPLTVTILLTGLDDTDIRPVTVFAETVAPGLAITPSIVGGVFEGGGTWRVRYTGGWSLTHTGSGTALHSGKTSGCMACVRAYAEAAVATGIDWTRPQTELAELIAAGGEHIEALHKAQRELVACGDFYDN